MADLVLPRRSFLGWTGALIGVTLFARPALARAVPTAYGWMPMPDEVVDLRFTGERSTLGMFLTGRADVTWQRGDRRYVGMIRLLPSVFCGPGKDVSWETVRQECEARAAMGELPFDNVQTLQMGATR